ncbi:MAG: transposase [Gemmatimonadetes bacterium]|nr:transposase [Gemmatimonadota bacterium]
MPRVKPVENDEMGWFMRSLMWLARRKMGRDPMPLRMMAHNPRFLLPYACLGAFAQGRTQLPAQVRALAMHRAAHINGCSWCIDYGQAVSQQAGTDPAKLRAVQDYAASPLFTPAERAALAYADEVTQVGGRPGDDTFAELRRHFNDAQIVELTAALAAEAFFNRMNAALGVEQQGFCELPAYRSPAMVAGAAAEA